jgi:hypothetical protein
MSLYATAFFAAVMAARGNLQILKHALLAALLAALLGMLYSLLY